MGFGAAGAAEDARQFQGFAASRVQAFAGSSRADSCRRCRRLRLERVGQPKRVKRLGLVVNVSHHCTRGIGLQA